MQNLPNDVLRLVALELDDASLLSLCRGNKRMNRVLCDSEIFWQQKHAKYGREKYIPDKSWKESYDAYKGIDALYHPEDFSSIIWELHRDSPEFVLYLLEKYGIPEQKNLDAALGVAAQRGYFRIVDLLLEKGADINSILYVDQDQAPPLVDAVKGRQVEMVKYLLEKGADPDLEVGGDPWSTALAMAINFLPYPYISNDREMVEIIQILANSSKRINPEVIFETQEKIAEYPQLYKLFSQVYNILA